MGKQRKKVTQAVVAKAKPKVKGNLFNINGNTIMDLFSTICYNPNDEYSSDIVLNTLVAVYAIFIMAQLRVSTTESNAFVDQLPSYKEYKKKIINGLPGRTLAALSAVHSSLQFIVDPRSKDSVDITSDDLSKMVSTYSNTPIPNSKRITTPNSGNWPQFLTGELSSTLGTILSCPSSNIKIFNLEADKVKNINQPSEILEQLGVPNDFLETHGIVETDEESTIGNRLKTLMHQTSGGIPVETLEFLEAGGISSHLENRFVGIERQIIERTAPGVASEINDSIKEQLLPFEKSAFNAAIKSGNKKLIKSFEEKFAKKYSKTDE